MLVISVIKEAQKMCSLKVCYTVTRMLYDAFITVLVKAIESTKIHRQSEINYLLIGNVIKLL